jgi:hypothetical protein
MTEPEQANLNAAEATLETAAPAVDEAAEQARKAVENAGKHELSSIEEEAVAHAKEIYGWTAIEVKAFLAKVASLARAKIAAIEAEFKAEV